ncbi:MAG: HD domain-containing protein [Desulfobacteraceae bacterium]|nr:HD domain-containing protein [Desulfobacteraceae bacterium]MCB9494605.1 HD domain-containing protein [Desulfobacteraceae bacterium]
MEKLAGLIFEARLLKNLPRSGYSFLGNGNENVAEHSFIVSVVSYILAKMCPSADEKKIVFMSLFHDLPESRTGDINYVQKKYVEKDENMAIEDIASGLFFGEEFKSLLQEFNEKKTVESKLANDADQIAFLVDLKVLRDKGAKTASKWIEAVLGRLKTDEGKKIAEAVLNSDSDSWWLENYVD